MTKRMLRLEPIKSGTHIFYRNNKYIDDLEFIVLEKYGKYCHCVSANPLKDEMSFDDHGNNDWKISSLRRYLNEEYIKKFNQDDVVRFNGDLITLLSKAQVEKYKDILPKYFTYWWTHSPYLDDTHNTLHDVWLVGPSGQLYHNFSMRENAVIPSCLFNLDNIAISQEEDNIIFES